MKSLNRYALLVLPCFAMLLRAGMVVAAPINRQALVSRHNPVVNSMDTLASLTVGNGRFAFTTDGTGLQTFPVEYSKGVPLGTQSEWAWHSIPNHQQYSFTESLRNYKAGNRQVSYGVQWNEVGRQKDAANYVRANPHRLQMGNVGFWIKLSNGQNATINDIQQVRQQLNLFTGTIDSYFEVEGVPVQVLTLCHFTQDVVAIKVKSALLAQNRLGLQLLFPYPTLEWADMGVRYNAHELHQTTLTSLAARQARIMHQLDTTRYIVGLHWSGEDDVSEEGRHRFTVSFSPKVNTTGNAFSFAQCQESSVKGWQQFWLSGGAVDFSGSTDERAHEVERRVVLSQYLTRVQCAGNFPPQETGLTYNSWYGKPHLEMHWWHAVHFALWGRPQLLQGTLNWYAQVYPQARALAKRQGYAGARWQKMVDHQGNESPSSVGAFIIWQQPHLITMAELVYKAKPSPATLKQYAYLVAATADFMVSFLLKDSTANRLILGPPVMPAQERFKVEETFNPTYELHYWHWALTTAQAWRKRQGLAPSASYQQAIAQLSALPVQQGMYLAAESAPDSYTNPRYRTDHPSVLGTIGMLPHTGKTDTTIMKNTFNWIWQHWDWQDTWGWDFPMTSMTATRLGMPDRAVEALLMPIRTNTYLVNGHNYQDQRLTLYMPGNGGVLTAVALMVAGFEGAGAPLPGIPKNGQWKVQWEGIKPMF